MVERDTHWFYLKHVYVYEPPNEHVPQAWQIQCDITSIWNVYMNTSSKRIRASRIPAWELKSIDTGLCNAEDVFGRMDGRGRYGCRSEYIQKMEMEITSREMHILTSLDTLRWPFSQPWTHSSAMSPKPLISINRLPITLCPFIRSD